MMFYTLMNMVTSLSSSQIQYGGQGAPTVFSGKSFFWPEKDKQVSL